MCGKLQWLPISWCTQSPGRIKLCRMNFISGMAFIDPLSNDTGGHVEMHCYFVWCLFLRMKYSNRDLLVISPKSMLARSWRAVRTCESNPIQSSKQSFLNESRVQSEMTNSTKKKTVTKHTSLVLTAESQNQFQIGDDSRRYQPWYRYSHWSMTSLTDVEWRWSRQPRKSGEPHQPCQVITPSNIEKLTRNFTIKTEKQWTRKKFPNITHWIAIFTILIYENRQNSLILQCLELLRYSFLRLSVCRRPSMLSRCKQLDRFRELSYCNRRICWPLFSKCLKRRKQQPAKYRQTGHFTTTK